MSSSAEAGTPRALEQRAFEEWPPSLRALFDGTALASKVGFTASLITCDAGGHLRTSLLGIGELYAPDSRCLAFALWPTSRAARTLSPAASSVDPAARGGRAAGSTRAVNAAGDRRRTRAALTFVHDGAFYQVQLSVERLADSPASGGPGNALAHFVASIDAGEAQQVGYAQLTSGIRFELSHERPAQEAVLERWQTQVEALRQATHAWLAAVHDPADRAR